MLNSILGMAGSALLSGCSPSPDRDACVEREQEFFSARHDMRQCAIGVKRSLKAVRGPVAREDVAAQISENYEAAATSCAGERANCFSTYAAYLRSGPINKVDSEDQHHSQITTSTERAMRYCEDHYWGHFKGRLQPVRFMSTPEPKGDIDD